MLVRKGDRRPEDAQASVAEFSEIFQVVDTTEEIFRSALQIANDHQLQIWDAIILAAAASAGCTLLLSEDFQHGFAWGGVTVVNPFATPSHPLLASIGQVP